MRNVAIRIVAVASALLPPAAWAGDTPPAPPAAVPVCTIITEAAQAHGLPLNFFTRLIWRESRFHADALSPVGAQGIAQFMPQTAAARGLADPFSVREALFKSAALLSELRGTFGNLGLAAVAYNAGPGRLSRWLAGQTVLPQETLDYVQAITGHSAAEWNAPTKPVLAEEKDFSCAHFAALPAATRRPVLVRRGATAAVAFRVPVPVVAPHPKPWAVILVGNPLREKVMAEYQTVKGKFPAILAGVQPTVVHRRISGLQIARYIVQVEHETRAGADTLCSKLQHAGGACFVLANKT